VDVRWNCKAIGVKSETAIAMVDIDSPEGKFSVCPRRSRQCF